MKILLLTSYFPPDTGSAAHLFYELGTELVAKGHAVGVVTSIPSYHAQGDLSQYQGRKLVEESVNGMKVLRVATPQLPRHLMFARAFWQFGSAWRFSRVAKEFFAADVIMVYSPPIPLGLAAWRAAKDGGKFILNVQDLFPQSIIDLGLLKNRILISCFQRLERFVYDRADKITVHSNGNKDYVVQKGRQDPRKVKVLHNWVDTDFIRPGTKNNQFGQDHELIGRFVLSFAGVIGYSQDVDTILGAAKLTSAEKNILWLIVGDGVEKARLEKLKDDFGLENVKFLPMQPREAYPSVLHSSDVGLSALRRDVKTPVVPSKILSIMAAGIPVLAAMPTDGDAPTLIKQAKSGICVQPGNPRALADAALDLYANRDKGRTLGNQGRIFTEEHLSKDACVSEYERLFEELVAST